MKDSCFETAKHTELSSWKQNSVYIKVPYTEQKLISLKWICSFKNIANNVVAKNRLVAKTFQEMYNEEILKDSSTCSKEALTIILPLIAHKKWKLNATDIKAAFLQGEETGRKVFVMPAKEAETNNIWLLKKSVHGLGDASRKWYNRVKYFLLWIRLKMSKGDLSIYYYYNDNVLQGSIAIFVDVCGLPQITLKQVIFKSYAKILSLVKKIILNNELFRKLETNSF